MVMNPSFNGSNINGTRLSFDSSLSSPGLIHFPNPNILKQGYAGYNIGNILTTALPYPRCHTTMRKSRHFVPNECKDEYYWHKRLKNNEAARKSRQKRRTIDSVLEEKVLILLHENQLLRQELYAIKVKYGEIAPSEHQEPSSSTESMMDCTKLKKPAATSGGNNNNNNISLTNKLISQALAKSDEKRIGLRQSLLETINMSLSKENDGKHKMHSQHHSSVPDTESLIYGSSNKMVTNGNGTAGMTSPSSSGVANASNAAKFPNELLSNLASGTYVLTSLSPGSEDMACLPSAISGCSSASIRSNNEQQQIILNCRIPTSMASAYQQQQSDCSTDEKAMEAANTLANLLKRSGSTHSTSSSLDHPLSPTSPTTPTMPTNGIGQHHPMTMSQHMTVCQQQQQQQLSYQQHQNLQQQMMMQTNESNQQHHHQQHHQSNCVVSSSSASSTPVHSPIPVTKQTKQCLPHKLRFKESKKV